MVDWFIAKTGAASWLATAQNLALSAELCRAILEMPTNEAPELEVFKVSEAIA
jgi:hypothetical protein